MPILVFFAFLAGIVTVLSPCILPVLPALLSAPDDMNDHGQIVVKEPRKYDVLNLRGKYGRHKLTLQVPKGVSLYAFTFGDEP